MEHLATLREERSVEGRERDEIGRTKRATGRLEKLWLPLSAKGQPVAKEH
jgi:hypothetical protein